MDSSRSRQRSSAGAPNTNINSSTNRNANTTTTGSNDDLQQPVSATGTGVGAGATSAAANRNSIPTANANSRNNVLPTASGLSDLDISLMMANPELIDLFLPDGGLAQGSSTGIPSIGGAMSTSLTYNPQEGFSLERLKSELVRLTTFYTSRSAWPKSFIKPEDCAKAGFYYLGDGDKVQCAFCHGVVGEWEQGDNPMAEHRQHFPRCPFVCGLPVENVPIGEDELAAAQGGGYDICGPFVPLPIVRPYAGADGASGGSVVATPVRGAQPIVGDMDDVTNNLAIRTGSGPVKKQLVTKETRLETFINWPLTCGQSADAMAEAGFYYIGIEDHVKCFYCDGGLKNWEPEDDPWAEHAKWYSECPFVKLNKGVEFIKNVLAHAGPRLPAATEPAASLNLRLQPNPTRRGGKRFVVTDDDVRNMIDTPLVQDVLRMGLNIGSVKAAIRHQLEHNGTPFINIETMLEAVLYEEEKDQEYYSDLDSDSDDDEDDPVGRIMEYDREPRSASSVLAARLTNLVKGSNLSPRSQSQTQGDTLAAGAEAGPSSGTSQASRGRGESSSQSGSEDEIMASASGSDSDRDREPRASTSSEPEEKKAACSSPSADSGEFSMSNGSGDEEPIPGSSSSSKKTKTTNSSNSDDKKARDLEEEVRTLREARQCKICMDNDADVVFLPCGHLISCVRCATALSTCALCRQPIKAVVRTYMS